MVAPWGPMGMARLLLLLLLNPNLPLLHRYFYDDRVVQHKMLAASKLKIVTREIPLPTILAVAALSGWAAGGRLKVPLLSHPRLTEAQQQLRIAESTAATEKRKSEAEAAALARARAQAEASAAREARRQEQEAKRLTEAKQRRAEAVAKAAEKAKAREEATAAAAALKHQRMKAKAEAEAAQAKARARAEAEAAARLEQRAIEQAKAAAAKEAKEQQRKAEQAAAVAQRQQQAEAAAAARAKKRAEDEAAAFAAATARERARTEAAAIAALAKAKARAEAEMAAAARQRAQAEQEAKAKVEAEAAARARAEAVRARAHARAEAEAAREKARTEAEAAGKARADAKAKAKADEAAARAKAKAEAEAAQAKARARAEAEAAARLERMEAEAAAAKQQMQAQAAAAKQRMKVDAAAAKAKAQAQAEAAAADAQARAKAQAAHIAKQQAEAEASAQKSARAEAKRQAEAARAARISTRVVLLEEGPPPLPPLVLSLAAAATVRGILLPFALLVASEASGWATLASRACSSVLLGGVAAMVSAQLALRSALFLALTAALAGLVGGAADSLSILTTSTFISTLSYAALPLSQAVAVRGCYSSADAAGRLGLLSAVDALASTLGVQATLSALSTSRWADGGPPSVMMCATAVVVAYAGLQALRGLETDEGIATWRGVEDTCREQLASVLCTIDETRSAAFRSIEAFKAAGVQAVTTPPVALHVLLLAAAVAIPAALLQHGIESMASAPSTLDKALDAILRLSVQGLLVSHIANAKDLGAKGAALAGCLILAAGSVVNVLTSLVGASEVMPHHLMTAGLYAAETSATTLVALSAALCAAPAARRALALVVLHTGITLGPALLPLVGWLVGNGARGRWVQMALLPAALVALVASPQQDTVASEQRRGMLAAASSLPRIRVRSPAAVPQLPRAKVLTV